MTSFGRNLLTTCRMSRSNNNIKGERNVQELQILHCVRCPLEEGIIYLGECRECEFHRRYGDRDYCRYEEEEEESKRKEA